MNNMPLALRGSRFVSSFLRAISVTLAFYKSQIDHYFEELNFYVRITPQVFLLERLLNKKIRLTNKKIRIGAPLDTPGLYLSPTAAASMCFFDNGDFFAFLDPFGMDFDFLVIVPVFYEGNENAINTIRFYLDKYKLISTNYKISFE
jgi:hypothetical protein